MGTLFHKTIQALISYALAILLEYKKYLFKNLNASIFFRNAVYPLSKNLNALLAVIQQLEFTYFK